MKDILTRLDTLKSLDCNNIDEVIELMHSIASNIDDGLTGGLSDTWFYLNAQSGYCRCSWILMMISGIVEINPRDYDDLDYNELLEDAQKLVSNIKDSSAKWFFYDGPNKQAYNIGIKKLERDKNEFIEQAIEILSRKM